MIVGITGGKGGTGKTVTAVNLAVALAEMGEKVTLVDCDADCPGAHMLMGAKLRNKKVIRSFLPEFDEKKCKRCGICVKACEMNALYQLKGKVPSVFEQLCSGCETCMLSCPYGAIGKSSKVIGWTYHTKKYGVSLFSGELKPSEPLSERVVDATKKRALKSGEKGFVIVDTAAGAHCPVIKALEGCERAFAVTEPTLFGAHDLKVISSVLKNLGIRYDVILNRSDISESRIAASMKIPYERKMVECYVEGVPIVKRYPEHPISRKFFKLARELMK